MFEVDSIPERNNSKYQTVRDFYKLQMVDTDRMGVLRNDMIHSMAKAPVSPLAVLCNSSIHIARALMAMGKLSWETRFLEKRTLSDRSYSMVRKAHKALPIELNLRKGF